MEAWEPIRPWLECLRGRMRVEEAEAPRSSRRIYSWMRVALPTRRRAATSEQVREIREALELLAIVAASDVDAWRQLLREACGVSLELDDDLEAESAPLRVVFVLDDHTKESILWPAALCNKLFGLLTPVTHSEAFFAARRSALQQMAAIRRRRTGLKRSEDVESASVPRIPFCLVFAPKRMGRTSLVQYLNSVRKVVMSVRGEQQSAQHGEASNGKADADTCEEATDLENNSNSNNSDNSNGAAPGSHDEALHAQPFVLDAIHLNLAEFEMNEAVAHAVEAIVGLGVTILCLQLSLSASDFLNDNECRRQPLASCYQAIAASDSKGLLSDSEDLLQILSDAPPPKLQPPAQASVETLFIDGQNIDDRRFAALCSSLAEARTVSHLVLEGVFMGDLWDVRMIKWKWLAFALAADPTWTRSSSSLRKLTVVEALLVEEDVKAMETVLLSDHPAMELVDPLWAQDDREALSAPKRVRDAPLVRLDKGAIIYTEPVLYPEDWVHHTIVVQHDASLAVMANDPEREWIDVLVPGYGKCWVHEDVATPVKRQTVASPSSIQGRPATRCRTHITALDLVVSVADASILVHLFELVGDSLEEVSFSVNSLSDPALGDILVACPRVRRLEVREAKLESLDVLLRSYNERDFCLTTLTLADFHIDTDCLLAFIHRLGDPDTDRSIGKRLKELCIRQMGLSSGDNGEDAVKDATRSVLEALLTMLDVNRTALEYFEMHLAPSFFEEFEARFRDRDKMALLQSDGRRPRLVPPRLRCRLAFLSVLKAQANDRMLSEHAALRVIFGFVSTPARRHVCIVKRE